MQKNISRFDEIKNVQKEQVVELIRIEKKFDGKMFFVDDIKNECNSIKEQMEN